MRKNAPLMPGGGGGWALLELTDALRDTTLFENLFSSLGFPGALQNVS